jgi:hypothetical protein
MNESAKAGDEEIRERLDFLFAESEEIIQRFGLSKGFVAKLFKADDWTFFILLACLIEAVLNETIAKGLKFMLTQEKQIGGTDFSEFIERLPMLGRSGRHALAKACKMPDDLLAYVEAVFLVRNSYAHKLSNVNKTIHELVFSHSEKTKLIRAFNPLANDPEDQRFLEELIQDKSLLRYSALTPC